MVENLEGWSHEEVDSVLVYVDETYFTITSVGKMQSNTTFNIYIAKRCFYITCLNNYMFRPLYRPLSGCTLSYYKANYTIYNGFVFVNMISFTSIKFAFKIVTIAAELKSYSNIKGINSIKSWMLWSREGEGGCENGDIPVWHCWFLCLIFHGGTVNWLPGSALMVNTLQMLHGGQSQTVVVVLISCRLLKYIYFIVQLEGQV
jgi:hypothetical protein